MVSKFSLSQFQQGDINMFKLVFDLYYQRLVLFAERYLEDLDDAEDQVQEVFVALWNRREFIDDETKIKPYLYVAIRNRCLNLIRDKKIHAEYNATLPEDVEADYFYESALIVEEVWGLLMKALDEVDENIKNVCLLSIEGFKNPEIAEKLDLSIRSVKYYKAQGRAKLAYILKDYKSVVLLLPELLN